MKHAFIYKAAMTGGICAIYAAPLLADFTYEQTSQITGGAMLQMVRVAGAFSKNTRKMTEPTLTTVSIKGNRMVHRTMDEATVIDLDQKTITSIHFAKKAYSVVTFEQMKQQMAEMADKMKSRGDGQQAPSFDVKVNDTGQTKNVNGNNTHEMVMTITMAGKDEKSGAQGALNVVSNMWIAPNVAGYQEARDFQRRMAEAIGWVPGENPMISRPDMVKAMSEVYKEGSKLDGMPMITIMKMGGTVQGTDATSGETPAADDAKRNENSKQEASAPPTSMGDALAGALGGRFGLGRRKKQQKSEEAANDSPAQSTDSKQSGASLIEMTSNVTNYNSGAVNVSAFEVPADFKKVDEDLMKQGRRR
jgi:hypothetical protein